MTSTLKHWLLQRHVALAVALLIALVAVAALACNGDDNGQVTGVPAEDQTFTLRIAADPGTFDPQLASFSEEISIVKQLFRGLFTYDEDLDVVPAVAIELPTKDNGGISEDGLTYTIKLRTDATWSDGAAVTADNFVYAFQRLFDPEAGAQGYYFDFYTAIAGGEAAAYDGAAITDVQVSALDDNTLQLTLTREQPTLLTLLALWPAVPLRQDLIEQFGDAWTAPGNLVGNGPFVLAEYTADQEIVLEANPSYWGDDQPALDRLVYRIIPEDSAALIAYEAGEIDMTSLAPDVASAANSADIIRSAQLETYALHYNSAEPPFDNVLVRQAFSRAIDRNAYVSVVQQGAGFPATGWLPPDMPGGNAAVGSDFDFNPAEAQTLLSDAGFPDGEGFPTVTFTIFDEQSNRDTAAFLQAQLSDNLGIDVQIETLEEGAYFDRFFVGDFQFTWMSWFADYADPENWLPGQFSTDGAFNVLGYSNTEVDALFAQAAVELDRTERLALYSQAHELIIADQAVTPIYNPERTYLVKPNVAGLVTTVLDAEPGDWFATSVLILSVDGAPPAALPDENADE